MQLMVIWFDLAQFYDILAINYCNSNIVIVMKVFSCNILL